MRNIALFAVAFAIAGCHHQDPSAPSPNSAARPEARLARASQVYAPAADEHAGHNHSTEGSVAREPAPAVAIAGDWTGKFQATAKGDDPAAKMAEAMMEMFGDIELAISNESRFKLTMMGIPVEGPVKIDGSKLTLKPDRIMGNTIADFKKLAAKNGKSSENADKAMTGTISSDGTSITITDPNQKDGAMVFKRAVSESENVGTSTVSGEESGLVGSYSAVVDPNGGSAKDREMFAMMKDSMKLKLNSDNTFKMSMMLKFEGTWKLDGDKLTMKATKAMGLAESKSDGPIEFKVVGSKLEPIGKGSEKVPFWFEKN